MSEAKKIQRTMAGLRETLFETLEDLRAGKVDAKDANAIVGVSTAILKCVSVQLDFERAKNDEKAPNRLPSMPLDAPLALMNGAESKQ